MKYQIVSQSVCLRLLRKLALGPPESDVELVMEVLVLAGRPHGGQRMAGLARDAL